MGFKDLVAGAMNWHKTINDNNAEAETRIGSLERNLYNPNLLINCNFKANELINQRGQSSYSNNGYIFDMWKKSSAYMDAVIELKTDYIRIKEKSGIRGYCIFEQRVEDFKNLEGKTVTFSFKAKSDFNSSMGSNIRIDNKDFKDMRYSCSKEFQIFEYTFTLPDKIESSALFRVFTNDENSEIDIEWIKLEFGEIATPFVDDDITIKLNKCQRYLQRIPYGLYRVSQITTSMFFTVPIKTMRIKPALVVNGSFGELILFGDLNTVIDISDKITGVLIQPTITDSDGIVGLRFNLSVNVKNYSDACLNTQTVQNMLLSAEL